MRCLLYQVIELMDNIPAPPFVKCSDCPGFLSIKSENTALHIVTHIQQHDVIVTKVVMDRVCEAWTRVINEFHAQQFRHVDVTRVVGYALRRSTCLPDLSQLHIEPQSGPCQS